LLTLPANGLFSFVALLNPEMHEASRMIPQGLHVTTAHILLREFDDNELS
jgi:hypothetical protein